jgi:hypothetical protein
MIIKEADDLLSQIAAVKYPRAFPGDSSVGIG